jgi:CheY-like chemotaxis protein
MIESDRKVVERTERVVGDALRAARATVQDALNNPLAVVIANLDLALESAGAMPDLRAVLLEARVAAQILRVEIARFEVPAVPSPAEPVREAKAAPWAGIRVLLVDDNAAILRAVKRTLRECDVVTETDPRAALGRIASGERFDVILSDLMMPDLPGPELYLAISAVAPDQAARVIFMTGGATTDDASRFIEDGAVPVLRKPFDVDRLRAAILRQAIKK